MHCLHVDEEALACGNLLVIHRDGEDRAASGSEGARIGAEQACRSRHVWEVHSTDRASSGAASAREDNEETASEVRSGRRLNRGDRGRGATISNELAPVFGAMEGLPSVVGGVADTGSGQCWRPSGELGASGAPSGHSSSGPMASDESMISDRPPFKACSRCQDAIRCVLQDCKASLLCDGKEHEGDRKLQGCVTFSCLRCGLDWCDTCASSLDETAGAKVVKIIMRPDTDADIECTLGLGWIYAVSNDSAAGCGPLQKRDHGHVVPRSKFQELSQRYDDLQLRCEQLQHELNLQGAKQTDSHITPSSHRTLRATRNQLLRESLYADSPPMLKLEDDTKRNDHVSRWKYQERYCSTMTIKAQKDLAEMQEEVARKQKACEDAHARAQQAHTREMNVRDELRLLRVEHREEIDQVLQRQKSVHQKALQDSKQILEKKHKCQTRHLRDEVAQLKRKIQDESASHKMERKRLCDEFASFKQGYRYEQKEHLEVEAREFKAKMEWAETQWGGERASLISNYEKLITQQHEQALAMGSSLRRQVSKARLDKVNIEMRMRRALKRVERQRDELHVEVHGRQPCRRGRPKPGLRSENIRLRQQLGNLQEQLNLRSTQLPSAQINGTERRDNMDFSYNLRFLAAALSGREAQVIAAALKRNNQLEDVARAKEMQPLIKQAIDGVLQVIQERWGARHAVILMQEVHTSRSEFDALRHLLSFAYNRDLDAYERVPVWTNPFNHKDVLHMPALASRKPREAERAIIYNQCGAQASDDGFFCGIVNFEEQASKYVEHYWEAIDTSVQSGSTPLMLILTGDATGGWRGDAVTHGEIGIGSWSKGKAQSRLTLLPLFLLEGDDSAENLRNRVAGVAKCYNRMKKTGKLTVSIKGESRALDLKLLVAADFQFFKAAMNMSKYTSAVWCACTLDNLFKRPDVPLVSWNQVLQFYDSIGCTLKDLKTICELNHYSFEVLEGREFQPFSCRCGWKSGNEASWRRAVEEHAQLEGDSLKAADLAHSSQPAHCRHKPFNPPLFHQGTLDMSADVLHLIFINMFTFFLEMTVLVHIHELSPTLREPFELYVRSIGLPMKIVKATSIEEMKQGLTGRDAKVVMSKAVEHISTLLEFAHSEPAAIAAEVQAGAGAAVNDIADDEFTWAGDSGDEEENCGAEDDDGDSESRMLKDAKTWDHFNTLCYAMRPFERDDLGYRQERAVEAFNAAALVMAEYKRLNPQAMSACPHVALVVVPRQMVAHGDPGRRGTDHSESYGAAIKDNIHRRCLRRVKAFQAVQHRRRNASNGSAGKTWIQKALSVSRIMQTFRDQAVRERILRDEESQPYLLRKHFTLATTGFSTVGEVIGISKRVEEEALWCSITARIQEGRNMA